MGLNPVQAAVAANPSPDPASQIAKGVAIAAPILIQGAGTLLGLDAANEAAAASEEASNKQVVQDRKVQAMREQQLRADRLHLIQGIRIQADQDRKIAAYKDAVNIESYKNRLAIRNREQKSLNNQYYKSEFLHDRQTDFNTHSANVARESAWRELEEINAEAAFNIQKQRIDYLQAEGQMRAKGVSGRSAGKSAQAAAASFGMQTAALNESLEGAGRNTRALLKEISNDEYSANLSAFAQKMLKPEPLPDPVRPIATPFMTFEEYQKPREIMPFDLGPEPVQGAFTTPSQASAAFWGKALPGLAQSVGNTFAAIDSWN